MALFSWEYEFAGAVRTWTVAAIFCAVAVVCGLILPFVLGPHERPDSVRSDGIVLRIETDEDLERPVFRFSDSNGVTREFASGISSTRSAYRVGERVTISHSATDPAAAFVMDDKDLVFMVALLRLLAAVFGGIGLAILAMKLKGIDDEVISRSGGLIGALSYAVPASLVLPGLWIAFSLRPNPLFPAEAEFGADLWLIGSVFSGTGLLALVATVALYRYQARTGKAGWSWRWHSGGSKDKGA